MVGSFRTVFSGLLCWVLAFFAGGPKSALRASNIMPPLVKLLFMLGDGFLAIKQGRRGHVIIIVCAVSCNEEVKGCKCCSEANAFHMLCRKLKPSRQVNQTFGENSVQDQNTARLD